VIADVCTPHQLTKLMAGKLGRPGNARCAAARLAYKSSQCVCETKHRHSASYCSGTFQTWLRFPDRIRIIGNGQKRSLGGAKQIPFGRCLAPSELSNEPRSYVCRYSELAVLGPHVM
jgi:hypothetical protein